MKALLFSLVVGLLVASQGEAQTDASQFTGRWLTHYLASDNIEKIREGGPFHVFLRYLEFDVENGTIHFRFYIKQTGECVEKYVSGLNKGDFYAVDYSGHNEFRVISVDEDKLIANAINVDEQGRETDILGLFGPTRDIDSKHREEFEDVVRERGIPEENILNFTQNDNCPDE